MATYTPNYQLHQWEPQDHFLRTDFNEDFAKIDAAVHTATRTAQNAASLAVSEAGKVMDALAPVSYNVYNLMLQNDYEGRETGFQKALLFDGFLDENRIASISGGGYDRAGRCLSMTAPLEDLDHMSANTQIIFPAGPGNKVWQRFFCTRSGTLTKITLRGGTASGVGEGGITMRVSVVDWDTVADKPTTQVLATSQNVTENPVTSGLHHFPISCPLKAGTYGLRFEIVTASGTIMLMGPYATGRMHKALDRDQQPLTCSMEYGLTLTPDTAASATLLSTAVSGGFSFRGARGWVRHSGGTVSLALKCGGTLRAMSAAGVRNTVELGGTACRESSFVLDLGSTAVRDPLAAQLTYNTGVVYDYGIAFY